ncbi:hypothetical protein [Actinoplanes sichuanensis]|uniref:Uncharacterized protein n=1 Tax=Actinoplanes sichuanensis TaxID=512349 RepID=A0ABW4AKY9_9ACTN|nr:hypothetical protein [Actinoplanes sichuanensis]
MPSELSSDIDESRCQAPARTTTLIEFLDRDRQAQIRRAEPDTENVDLVADAISLFKMSIVAFDQLIHRHPASGPFYPGRERTAR